MEISYIIGELQSIAELSPRLRGWLNTETRGGSRVGLRWANLMVDLDRDHFENVCFEFANGERRLPESYEELMHDIIEESRNRRALEIEKGKLQEEVWGRCAVPWRDRKPGERWCQAIKWIMQNGPATKQQVDELVAWDQGGAVPAFLMEAGQ